MGHERVLLSEGSSLTARETMTGLGSSGGRRNEDHPYELQ